MANIEKCRAHECSRDTERILLPDTFHAQKAEQVQSGQGEQDDPKGQKPLSRDHIPLQDLIDCAQILQHDGENDESQNDLDARQPAAATRHSLQKEQERAQGKRMVKQVPMRMSSSRAQVECRRSEPSARAEVPINGPTQANEVSEKVRPMSSVPIDPPRWDA